MSKFSARRQPFSEIQVEDCDSPPIERHHDLLVDELEQVGARSRRAKSFYASKENKDPEFSFLHVNVNHPSKE